MIIGFNNQHSACEWLKVMIEVIWCHKNVNSNPIQNLSNDSIANDNAGWQDWNWFPCLRVSFILPSIRNEFSSASFMSLKISAN